MMAHYDDIDKDSLIEVINFRCFKTAKIAFMYSLKWRKIFETSVSFDLHSNLEYVIIGHAGTVALDHCIREVAWILKVMIKPPPKVYNVVHV